MKQQRRGFRADRGHSYASIEALARQVRKFLVPDLQPDEPLPLGDRLFDLLSDLTVDTSLGKTPVSIGIETLSPQVGGETRFDKKTRHLHMVLSTDTYMGLLDNNGRARFTLGHEIFHLLEHPELAIKLSKVPHLEAALQRQLAEHPLYFDTEAQSDWFSAALLAPAMGIELLRPHLGRIPDHHDVATRFLMSHEAAEYRLDTYAQRRDQLLQVWKGGA